MGMSNVHNEHRELLPDLINDLAADENSLNDYASAIANVVATLFGVHGLTTKDAKQVLADIGGPLGAYAEDRCALFTQTSGVGPIPSDGECFEFDLNQIEDFKSFASLITREGGYVIYHKKASVYVTHFDCDYCVFRATMVM